MQACSNQINKRNLQNKLSKAPKLQGDAFSAGALGCSAPHRPQSEHPAGAARAQRSSCPSASPGAAASAMATECKPTSNLSHRRYHAPSGKWSAHPRGSQKKPRRVRAGMEKSFPVQRIAPSAAHPGRPLPMHHRPRVPNPRRLTNAALPSLGIRAAGATPAMKQARSRAQHQLEPRRLQSPRPGPVLG